MLQAVRKTVWSSTPLHLQPFRAMAASGAGAAGRGLDVWPVNRVRQQFVDFFVEKYAHTHVPGAPVVPHNDPTLLFVNAGMNQYKSIFTGQVPPTSPLAVLKRAANSQPCIRAGGKHNDLEDVGKDTYHHTFFEMLGSWSFGDYFKKETIDWSWELMTEVYGLEPECLYATYFEGDENVPADIEAKELWLKYLPEERVIGSNAKDNFWEMGATGPCGPCSELHYDRLARKSVPELVNADDPTLIEVWNLVFMQYFRDDSGKLAPLPAKHIDTGMGLERLASILQGKQSNYDTDVFMPTFEVLQNMTGARPYSGKLGAEDVDGVDTAYRVIADHVRTLTFAIADGAVPSSEGRGYVLRRILRRAVRMGREALKADKGFFSKLVPHVVAQMGDAFPNIVKQAAFVQGVVEDEEDSFSRTLKSGIDAFNKIHARVAEEGGKVIPGADAFFLYDSMGFPVDLTAVMAEEKGCTVDEEGFHAAMAEQKKRSQEANAAKKGVQRLVLEAEQTAGLASTGVPVTDDEEKYVMHAETQANVVAVWTGSELLAAGVPVTAATGTVGVILDRTAFYAEAGGQEFDQGKLLVAAAAGDVADAADVTLDFGSGTFLEVDNTQSFAGFVLHIGTMQGEGQLAVGDTVQCAVDYKRRELLAPNHTMTHVLNFALRKALGDKVDQKGSLVAPDKLRFDFSQDKAITPAQLQEVEACVQEQISQARPVYSQVCSLPEARKIHSLRAVFGETYPDPVRVISVGEDITAMLADPENTAKWTDVSVEFCGGTHLKNTSNAGAFAIVEEGAVAKGIRRVVAVTKNAARDALDKNAEMEEKYSEASTLPWAALEARLVELGKELDESVMSAWKKAQLREQHTALGKTVAKAKKSAADAAVKEASAAAKAAIAAAVAGGDKWVSIVIDGDQKTATGVQKDLKKAMGKATEGQVPLLGVTVNPGSEGKPGNFCIMAVVPRKMEAYAAFDAVEWAAAAAEAIGEGAARGKPDASACNGKLNDAATAEAAVEAANVFAGSKLA